MTHPAVRLRRALIVSALLPAVPAAAQQLNPGLLNPNSELRQLQRQEEQFERGTRPPPASGPVLTAPRPPRAEFGQPGGPRFVLRAITFDHSAFLTPAELDAVAARYVGKAVDFSDLQRLVHDVNALYEEKGEATAAASLGPQRIVDGRVKITLTEGRLGAVKTEGRKQTTEAFFDRRLGLVPGETIDVPDLAHRARVINATSDVRVRLSLEPGASFGLTDVTLGVTEPPINTLQLFADNQAVQTTGVYEGGFYFKRSGLLGIDDRLTVYGVGSAGDLAGNVGYNLPIGDWGTRLGVSFGRSVTRVVYGSTEPLRVRGSSETASVNASQPLYVTDHMIAQAVGSFTYQSSESTASDVTITRDNSYRESIGLSISYSDDRGTVTFAPAIAPVQAHPLVPVGNRDFTLFVGNANAMAALTKDLNFQFNMAWQWTTARLLPSDQLFQIGGPTTVRGFPTDGLAGDSGVYANFELHHQMKPYDLPVDVYAFGDVGAVASTFPTGKSMSSVGIGGSVTLFDRVTLQGVVAVPLGLSVPEQRGVELYFRVILTIL